MVLQSLCSLAVQCVVPVVVLVQHRAERILCTVPKEDPGRLRVHIGPHPAVCLSRTVLQHVFQNRRGAGCCRVQLDHLASSVVRIAQGPVVNGLTPARQALFRQISAQLALGPPGLCRIPAVGVGDLQRVPALEVAQHIVHVGRHAAAGARQLQRLVKGLHVLHLAQPVQSGCCRRIAVTVHAFRLFQADLLRRLFAHLPAPQHLLRPGLLLALRLRCFHAVGLPHRAVAAVHPVKGAFFHRDRLHHSLPVSSILRCQLNVSRPANGPHTRGTVSAYALTKGFCTVRCCFRGAFHTFPSVLNSILLAALCRHFPQHPPGSRSRARQLHPIGFLKSRAVCLVSGLRVEQPDGLACQAVTGRRFCKRLHSQVVRYGSSFRTVALSRRARRFQVSRAFFSPIRLHRHAKGPTIRGAVSAHALTEGFRFPCQLLPALVFLQRLLVFVLSGIPLHVAPQAGISRVHPGKPCAHSAAQCTGRAAGQPRFQRLNQRVRGKHGLGSFAVSQGRINGLVGVGLHKGLHGVVNAAGNGVGNCRMCRRKGRIPSQRPDLVCHSSRHGISGVVRAHGSCQISRTHAVDGPSCAKLGHAAHQRLACAFVLGRALAHGIRSALGTQHRQHRRRVDGSHGKVLCRAGRHALHGPLHIGQAALGRARQLLAPVVQLVAHALLRVDATLCFRSGNAAAHVLDLLPGKSLLQQVAGAVLGLVVHVSFHQLVIQVLLAGVPGKLCFQCFPVLAALPDVLSGLHQVLRTHQRGSGHGVRNAAHGVCRPPGQLLPLRDFFHGVQILPGLPDLRVRVPQLFQVRRAVGVAHLPLDSRGAEGVDATIPGAGPVSAGAGLGIAGIIALLFQQLVHKLLIPRLVKPLVGLVKGIRLAVLRIAVLQLLGLLSVPRSLPRRAHCHLLPVQLVAPVVHGIRKAQVVPCPVILQRRGVQVGARLLFLGLQCRTFFGHFFRRPWIAIVRHRVSRTAKG